MMNWAKWWKIQAKRYYKRHRKLIKELEQVWEIVAKLEQRLSAEGIDPRLRTGCPMCGRLLCRGECFK